MSHRVVVSVRLGTGPVSCGRAAGGRACRAGRAAHPRAPRLSPRASLPPALTLRANHTPNNAAAYYLLKRFICSYIGLMVSDRCERLRAALRQHPASYYAKRVVTGARPVGLMLMASAASWCAGCWWVLGGQAGCQRGAGGARSCRAPAAATHMRGQVARKSFIDSRAPAF